MIIAVLEFVLPIWNDEPTFLAVALVWAIGASTAISFVMWLIALVSGTGEEILEAHLVSLAVLLLSMLPPIAAWVMIESYFLQMRCRKKLEIELGFHFNVIRGYLTLTEVDNDGAFAHAGFCAGDIIDDDLTINGLLRRLHIARGNPPVCLTVIRRIVVDGTRRTVRRTFAVRVQ